ncbi:MAG: ABC transporter substrate-binding protein [Desulfobacteraceae bacterium]|nr:ABC transporter substrate-binding protein [Desulfobacteraceae bacterium]
MKRLGLLLAVVGLILTLSAPSVLAKDTLVVVQEAEPLGLDMMRSSIQTTMSVCYNLHDTLFAPQEDASVKPRLAEKWEKTDNVTWKIFLRKDAVFHNGEPVNAHAVKFSFDRAFDKKLKNPHKGKLSAFKEVVVIDDYTVTFSTHEPYAPGLYILGYYLPIVPPGYIKKVGDTKYNTNPVGCGPYKLEKWIRGEQVIMKAFDKYYGPKPAYKKLIFKGVPEEASRVAMLLTREADVISGIPVHQRKKISDSGKAYLTDQMGAMPYLGLNTYKPPLDNVKVRQALNYALNRDVISKALFNDQAIICRGPISPRTFGADPNLKPYPYDTGKAKKLLAEAGYPKGFDIRLAYPTYMSQIQEQAEVIAANLGEVGVGVKLEPFERAVMWERYKGKKHQMFIYWWDDAPEPDRYMYSLFHSKSRDYYYKNPEADKLLDKGRTVMDRAERAKLYNQLDALLYKDAPWVYLYVIPEVFGVNNKVEYKGKRDGFLDMRSAKPKS